MARVNGRRTTKRVPCPGRESMVTEPPSCLISLATTSMPTPRPDSWVTWLAVEKPAWKMNCCTSWSGSGVFSAISPRSMALRRTASVSMPLPSSARVITTSPPSRESSRLTWPLSSLPAPRRCSGSSMPWSTALRSICSSGATTRSIRVRSSSPSGLITSKATRLPTSPDTCRTMRRRRGTRRENGTMRVRMSFSCRSVLMRCCCSSRVSVSRVRSSRVFFRSSRSEADSESCLVIWCSSEYWSISSGSKRPSISPLSTPFW